jgi:hypothetical protein
MALYLLRVYQKSGNARWYAMLWPIGAGMLIAIFAYALRTCRTGRYNWRNTLIQTTPSASGRAM